MCFHGINDALKYYIFHEEVVTGEGNVSSAQIVKEVKQGQHLDSHSYKRNSVEYARNNPNNDKPDKIND